MVTDRARTVHKETPTLANETRKILFRGSEIRNDSSGYYLTVEKVPGA